MKDKEDKIIACLLIACWFALMLFCAAISIIGKKILTYCGRDYVKEKTQENVSK